MKVLLSGHIETNPGPIENVSNSISFFSTKQYVISNKII